MAARVGPRTRTETSAPPLAARAAICPPTAPAPKTQSFMIVSARVVDDEAGAELGEALDQGGAGGGGAEAHVRGEGAAGRGLVELERELDLRVLEAGGAEAGRGEAEDRGGRAVALGGGRGA